MIPNVIIPKQNPFQLRVGEWNLFKIGNVFSSDVSDRGNMDIPFRGTSGEAYQGEQIFCYSKGTGLLI